MLGGREDLQVLMGASRKASRRRKLLQTETRGLVAI
jgi:hypothetical protein